MHNSPSDQIAEQAWMRVALHDLCQPLTAVECRLFIGTMGQDGREPSAGEMRETIRESLVECERMIYLVRAMQERLHEGHSTEAHL
jgi:hypothetical protein